MDIFRLNASNALPLTNSSPDPGNGGIYGPYNFNAFGVALFGLLTNTGTLWGIALEGLSVTVDTPPSLPWAQVIGGIYSGFFDGPFLVWDVDSSNTRYVIFPEQHSTWFFGVPQTQPGMTWVLGKVTDCKFRWF